MRVVYKERHSGLNFMDLMTYHHLSQYITTNLTKIMEPTEAASEGRRWLSEGLGLSLAWIIAHNDDIVPNNSMYKVESWLRKRHQGNPWTYIIGWTPFWGRRYRITPDTLIPRPETEMVLEAALNLGKKLKVQHACDIGTGSGIIAISMALDTNWKITATDISMRALRVAKKNAKNLRANIEFYHGNLLEAVPNQIELVVANPPYVDPADAPTLKKELTFEPKIALFADNHGLAIAEMIIHQAFDRSARGCVLEIGAGQGDALQNYALTTGWHHTEVHKDLAGHDRVLLAW